MTRQGRSDCIHKFLPVSFLFAFLIASPLARGEGQAESDDPAMQLQQLLDSEALSRTDNPAAANFFLQRGRGSMSADDEQRAIEQLRRSLQRQTSFMGRTMESVVGAMSGKTLQQVMERAAKQSGARSMLGGMLGMPPQQAITTRQQQQMQTEIQEGIATPWIRGVEAAKALEQIGEVQAAGRFYMNCLQMDPSEWFADVCLDGIVQMGPARAYALLNWIVDSAEKASFGAQIPDMSGAEPGTTAFGVAILRSAGLRGLGMAIGSGRLSADDREQAWKKILAYADGKENAPYFAGVATGLGLTRDPRAVAPLRRLAEWKKDPKVKHAAQRALAGLGDEKAKQQLRRSLKDEDLELRLRAARALMEVDDEQTYQWAVDQATSRRSADNNEMDIRPRIVRELADRASPQSRQALQKILSEGAGNDWLQAWVSVALLDLGDDAQLPAVSRAVNRSDWTLDKSGIGSLWRRISPLLSLAAQTAFSQVSVMQTVQTVGNMIAQERARAQKKITDRALVSLQIRWQAADALAASHSADAVAILSSMIDDPEPSVRLSAARALAMNPSPAAGPAIARAFDADYGSDGEDSRTPQVRAALLRAAIERDYADSLPLCRKGATDPDPGVRFIALVRLAKNSDK